MVETPPVLVPTASPIASDLGFSLNFGTSSVFVTSSAPSGFMMSFGASPTSSLAATTAAPLLGIPTIVSSIESPIPSSGGLLGAIPDLLPGLLGGLNILTVKNQTGVDSDSMEDCKLGSTSSPCGIGHTSATDLPELPVGVPIAIAISGALLVAIIAVIVVLVVRRGGVTIADAKVRAKSPLPRKALLLRTTTVDTFNSDSTAHSFYPSKGWKEREGWI
ncbi:hypothetical protein RQP46_002093 [Phenoliferia psychrophenolica]